MMRGRMTPQNELREAVGNGWEGKVRLLLKQGVDPNIMTRPNGDIPLLMDAVALGKKQMVGDMIEAGADVNAPCVTGATALMWAAGERSLEILKMLLEAEADSTLRDEDGNGPLHNLCKSLYSRDEEMEKSMLLTLLMNIGELSERNGAGDSPLDLAKRNRKSLAFFIEGLLKAREESEAFERSVNVEGDVKRLRRL